MSSIHAKHQQQRQKLLHILEHFEHILPAQAPIKDFVHHNTLHGFEHLKFPDALQEAHQLTGAYGYWPQEKFREAYLQGRIHDHDIAHALNNHPELASKKIIFQAGERTFYRRNIYQIALLHPIKNLSNCQLRWQIEEGKALSHFQADVPQHTCEKLLQLADAYGLNSETATVHELWFSCLEVLKLDTHLLHPEDFNNLSAEQSEKIFNTLAEQLQDSTTDTHASESSIDPLIRQSAWALLDDLLAKVGTEITLRSFLLHITGVDIQTEINAYLQPYLANWLDQGIAAWKNDFPHNNGEQDSHKQGFYAMWKYSALNDKNWLFNDLPDWKEHINSLPEDALDTIIAELNRMGIPEPAWSNYIERLALDLPGWSGMFYWRHCNPNYEGQTTHIDMMDYLAVRLISEHIYAHRLCRELWLTEANLDTLRGYFRQQHSEFLVRYTLNNTHLPEYLLNIAQQIVTQYSQQNNHLQEWQLLAQRIWTWQQADKNTQKSSYRLQHEAWKLFRLAQHLGLCSADVLRLKKQELKAIFHCLAQLNTETSGFVLLQAYEHHYREELFSAISHNQGRGTWKTREARPEAQLIFCMDDREESMRRHLEHLNPKIETFGAAAFFGVVMNWQDLDEAEAVTLCPVVVTPEHTIQEVAPEGQEQAVQQHQKRYRLRSKLNHIVHQETQRNLLSSSALIALNTPLALSRLVGKILAPLAWGKFEAQLNRSFDKDKPSRIISTAESALKDRSTENNQQGFTIAEQVNIVESFLQNNGLLSGFSPLVVLIGHYSHNQNNPHTAAYGCGACSGKYSGPNGRVFAAMANHPDVRNSLFERNIKIPDDCWFIGAEHDTCSEHITWYDIDLIPTRLRPCFNKLRKEIGIAKQHSAHERCRKLASAPRKPSLLSAIKHIAGRGVDFSQARPELGHATNAIGFVGRRYLSQGLFMDRRSFLISYDASVDPEGKFLERILLSAGPVGAGINLEYYFSTVNNAKYGSSSKIVHNVSGRFGVMEGTGSDLRTGLPQQMIEIHEPMRLQLMVEAKTEVLTEIYLRQPSLQQLIGNGWLLLSAKDPDSASIQTFDPQKGWQKWIQSQAIIPKVEQSSDWYSGHMDHLPPALIKRPAHHA